MYLSILVYLDALPDACTDPWKMPILHALCAIVFQRFDHHCVKDVLFHSQYVK
jgi:hypothetical protein